MKLIKKNLLVAAFLLCSNAFALNAQYSISDFLNERSYIGESYPMDELLVSYSFENYLDNDNSIYQLRSGEVEDFFESMGGDTLDPGNTAPIGGAGWFWVIVAMVYVLNHDFHKIKRLLRFRKTES